MSAAAGTTTRTKDASTKDASTKDASTKDASTKDASTKDASTKVRAAKKTVLGEAVQIRLASELARMGARLQVLESETTLSRERLLRLYKEINGESPPKGMLPFSTDWFLTWQPNIHSSLFLGSYRHLAGHCKLDRAEALVRAYRLYLEQTKAFHLEEKLSITRAWILVRYIDSGMLGTTPCSECGGHFVTHRDDLNEGFVCGLCNVPSRAGKTRAAKAEAL